ncbi:MAG: hypothetical protein AAFU71_19070, partial [Cyanobacteria bacterium J06632_22]
AALFFLLTTLRQNWQDLLTLQITPATWAGLAIALGVTLLAHIWSGWVWHWILLGLGIQVRGLWSTTIYLQTNVAKYLPGNVWHFYGRVRALQAAGATAIGATAGVLLEPVLMAAAALLLVVLASGTTGGSLWLPLGALTLTLAGLHPRLLNPLLNRIHLPRVHPDTAQPSAAPQQPKEQLLHYPLKPLLGELGFVTLRGLGFALVLNALQPLSWVQLLPILGAFGAAWLLGLVIPGAPGGIGIFEAVAIALLQSQLPVAQVLSGVIGYRLVSTLAEAIGAGLIWLDHPSRNLAIEAAAPFLLPPGREPELPAALVTATAPSVASAPLPSLSQTVDEDVTVTPEPSELPPVTVSPGAAPDTESGSPAP